MNILYYTKRAEQRELLAVYKQNYSYNFIEYTFENKPENLNFIQRLRLLREIKKFCADNSVDAIWVFGEMDAEFVLLLSAGKSMNLVTLCFQWAISFKKTGYDILHKNIANSNINLNKKLLGKAKLLLKQVIYKTLGYDYRAAIYLGDGLAKYLVTLGPYWSEKFKQEGISPNKIITGFFPFQYRDFKIEGAQSVLVILGAGQEIYQHSIQLKDWVQFLDRCRVDRANIVVRPHPKTSKKNFNDIVKFGLTVKKDQNLDTQIHESSAVCLDRSTVMLRCVQMNKPIIFYEDLPEAFLDISKMGFRLLPPTKQDAARRYYASDKEWLVGSEEKAMKTIKDVLERNEHALGQ